MSEEFPIHCLKINKYKYKHGKRNGENHHFLFYKLQIIYFFDSVHIVDQYNSTITCILRRRKIGRFTCKLIKGRLQVLNG